jgi:hypothetical protein
MLTKDLENFKIITDLVQKHFSLDDKGLKLFSGILNDTDKRMEYIPDSFHDKIGEDFRIRFPLGNEVKEHIDSGWSLFTKIFSGFCFSHDLGYNSYEKNKLTVKKNEVKLFKFMKKWYSEYDEEAKREFCERAYRSMDMWIPGALDFDETFKIAIEKVGTMKLPSQETEIVISFNFADWFMCSTAEDWSSCLNLDTDYESCYWTGLPGLIADKNRMMIYITDGKKKTYEGIEVDRVISRTWALMDDDDVVVPQRHYPQSFMSSYKYAELFDFKVADECLNNRGDFKSKYPLVDMVTNYNDETIFVYQDHSCFEWVDGFDRSKGVNIVDGSSGMHKITNYDSYNKSLDEDTLYHFTDGLAGLIERGTSISEYEGDGCYCEDCGCTVGEDEHYRGSDEGIYCESCFNESFFYCEACNEVHNNDYCNDADGYLYCESCYDERFSRCEECDCTIDKDEVYRHNGDDLCDSCYSDKVTQCDECNTEVDRVDTHETNDGQELCNDCYEKHKLEEEEEEKEGVA